MINAFIPPNSKLLVDRSITPKNGDIVLASVNGEFMVKFLKKNEFKCWLCPANSKYTGHRNNRGNEYAGFWSSNYHTYQIQTM